MTTTINTNNLNFSTRQYLESIISKEIDRQIFLLQGFSERGAHSIANQVYDTICELAEVGNAFSHGINDKFTRIINRDYPELYK